VAATPSDLEGRHGAELDGGVYAIMRATWTHYAEHPILVLITVFPKLPEKFTIEI
jgi:hypothetical protein